MAVSDHRTRGNRAQWLGPYVNASGRIARARFAPPGSPTTPIKTATGTIAASPREGLPMPFSSSRAVRYATDCTPPTRTASRSRRRWHCGCSIAGPKGANPVRCAAMGNRAALYRSAAWSEEAVALDRTTHPGVSRRNPPSHVTRPGEGSAHRAEVGSRRCTAPGLVAQNVALPVRIERNTREQRPLGVGVDLPSKSEVQALLQHAAGVHRPRLVTLIFTGLRASELRAQQWSNVDFAARTLCVRARADEWGAIGATKSRHGYRDIPMSPLLINT